jgi:hypothetical protein
MRVRVRIRRRRDWSDESGVTIVIVTMALMAICGMLVLVIDVGGLLTLRRQMVTAADSAALAAAQSCAANKASEASDQANLLATSNQSEATQLSFETTNCGTSSSGTASVEYSAPKTLAFAPILGYPDERPVPAEATAIWGPTGGDTPMPIEFSINPEGLIPCVYQEVGTECNYWWDNSNDHDLTSSSAWGFMNLATAGIAPDASCPNAGTNDRRDWIYGNTDAPLAIEGTHTYVCVDSGHSNSSWMEALQNQVGKIKHFPVNDPDAMIRTSGREKYAVIGFVALRVEAVYKGNDPAAVGTQGLSGRCSGTNSFGPSSSFDVDSLGCYGSADTIDNLELQSGRGNNRTTYVEGTHFTLDPTSHVITWFTTPAQNVSISFDWAQAGSAGKCGSRPPDPNAICLSASWQGVQVGGSLPGNGADFGLRAIRLDQ